MTYLLALIAIVAIAVLCWKAFGPQRVGGTREPSRSPLRKRDRRVLGPDDDPEFLWGLSHQNGDSHQNRDGEPGSGPKEH
ncbi:hypothetical protein [Nocardia callitridis]|uniref:Secreted protein n=1 Tax=Nocardia callitridis TaxID=648753 RepID=A0ABP9JTS3_9NOCA